MKAVCVECGKLIDEKRIKGSIKHPYCSKCFKKIWKNDYQGYMEWLAKTHV
jgi:DNA-directed RNA polymerase subunit RPC12/RpoP